MKRNIKELMPAIAGFALSVTVTAFIFLCLLFLSGGCTRKIYVPTERVVTHTDTLYQSRLRIDTMRTIERVYEADFRYDSIAPILDSLNNVIGWDRYHFRESTKMNEREIRRLQSQVDSLRAVKQDSVYVRVPVPVERELTKWEHVRMDAGGFTICLGAAVALMGAIALVIKWIVRKKRRV